MITSGLFLWVLAAVLLVWGYVKKRRERKAAIAAASILETPDEARERVRAGGPTPEHYIPTPPLDESEIKDRADDLFNPYKTAKESK